MIIKIVNKLISKAGFRIEKIDNSSIADIRQDSLFMSLYEKCKPYTMTSMERLYSLHLSVNYIIDNDIPGDLVECGVWKGGSAMMMALTLMQRNQVDRQIHLYDTYEGMSQPTAEDKTYSGENASDLLEVQEKDDVTSIWCYSSLDEVKKNLSVVNYPGDKISFVKGMVEETLQHYSPNTISLLRLDTDWYQSTLTELTTLYPRLSEKGVLIIDDFGHWEGAKKAVLEYFANNKPLLNRIDNTGRIMIK